MEEKAPNTLQMAMDHAHALQLLEASHGLYREIVDTLRETVEENGRIDAAQMAQRINQALTSFAPRDIEIQRMLDDSR